MSKSGPKSGQNPVRFPTVIHKVTCFWTVFFKTFKSSVSNLHCSVPCVTRTYPQYGNSRKSVTDRQTHRHTDTLTGHPDFDYPTNVRALRAMSLPFNGLMSMDLGLRFCKRLLKFPFYRECTVVVVGRVKPGRLGHEVQDQKYLDFSKKLHILGRKSQ